MDTYEICSTDGTALATYHWAAPATPVATVVIVHGLAEHGRRYATFAGQLAAAGLSVYAFDLRGHGATTPAIDHGHLGCGTNWHALLADVATIHKFATQRDNHRPAVLFGHGLGSFIVQATVQTQGRDYAGVILSAPANPGRWRCRLSAIIATVEALRVDPAGPSRLFRRLTFGHHARQLARRTGQQRTGFDWLSSDAAAVDAYIADEQTGFDMCTGAWQALCRGIARTQSPHARRRAPASLPLLIVAGSEDPVGGFGKAPTNLAKAYANNGQRDVTMHLYAGARHEIIHDHHADTIVHDILTWLVERHPIIPPTIHKRE